MKRVYAIAVAIILFSLFFIGQAMAAMQDCAIETLGRTGNDLPAVFKSAVKALPKELGIRIDNVVLVDNMDRFMDCVGVKHQNTRLVMKYNQRSFTIAHNFPIFFNGELPDTKLAVEYFDRGLAPHLAYTFASWIGHEYVHAVLKEDRETVALEKERELLVGYIKAKKMPQACQMDVETVSRRLQEAVEVEQAGGHQVQYATLPGGRAEAR